MSNYHRFQGQESNETIAPEIRISEQIVQVVREELEHKAEVVAPCIVVLQPDDVELVRGVGTIHQLEEPDLDLGLRIEKVDVLNVITNCL